LPHHPCWRLRTTAAACHQPDPAPRARRPESIGIAYLCDGRKEVSVVYAKNRASVTLEGKTWRMDISRPTTGFR